MTTLPEAATTIVAELRKPTAEGGPGLVVATSPHDINPPCVWLQPAEIEHLGLSHATLLVAWHLWIIANDVDTITALTQIDEQRAKLVALGGIYGPDNPARWLPLQIPGADKPIPALRFTIRTKIT